jgi:hypothetical protein
MKGRKEGREAKGREVKGRKERREVKGRMERT